jgi:hypothetical protein
VVGLYENSACIARAGFCVVVCVATPASLSASGGVGPSRSVQAMGTKDASDPHEHSTSMLELIAQCHSAFFRLPNSGPGGRRFKSSHFRVATSVASSAPLEHIRSHFRTLDFDCK